VFATPFLFSEPMLGQAVSPSKNPASASASSAATDAALVLSPFEVNSADDKGYVKMPNVDMLVELADMREASRAYTANTQVIKQVRELVSMTIDLLRPGS